MSRSRPRTPRSSPGRSKLRARGSRTTHSFVKSSSLGQYVAMVSGQYTACEANNDLPDHCHQRVPNLFSQLTATGRGWRDYEQSMPNACNPVDGGAAWARNIYSAHHNPALYFTRSRAAASTRRSRPQRPAAASICRWGPPPPTTPRSSTMTLPRAMSAASTSSFRTTAPTATTSAAHVTASASSTTSSRARSRRSRPHPHSDPTVSSSSPGTRAPTRPIAQPTS